MIPKKLLQTWKRKLKDSGFNDLEDCKGNLVSYHSSRFQTLYSPAQYEAQERYYQLAGQLLHSHKFDSVLDKTIWRYHAQGLPLRTIARKVGKDHVTVFKIVQHYAGYIIHES